MSCPECDELRRQLAQLRELAMAIQSRALRAEATLADASVLLSGADRDLDKTNAKHGCDDETFERQLAAIGKCHAIH